MPEEKGGRNAAFFLFLFAVAVLGFGGSLQYPLAVLRAGAFGAAIVSLWMRRGETVPVSPYLFLAGGFVVLAIGHSFSSIYFWVSFQHALNIALAAVLLAWAVHLFRRNPGKTWDAVFIAGAALALAELGIALFQRVHDGAMRPRGTFDNANFLSEFLAAASILCWAGILWERGSSRLRIAAGAGGLLFLGAAFSLAGSRGVLLAAVPAYGVLLGSRFGIRKGGALLAGVGIPALGLLGWRVAGRFFWPDIYNYSRWNIWKSAILTFLDHPFGVGLGGFKYYWFATQTPVVGAFRRYGKFADTAHSEYLEVLSGLGAVGLLVFIAVLLYPLVLAARKRKEIPADRRHVAAGAAGCLVLSGAHALFNANFHVFGIFFLDAVMVGALLAALPEGPPPAMTLPAWVRRAAIPVAATLLAATASTAIGAFAFDRGERRLRLGDLSGAERAFRAAIAADPFRSVYPDALSSVHFRRFLAERTAASGVRSVPEAFAQALRWEEKARSLNPREFRFTLRSSRLMLELFRREGRPSNARAALWLAGIALRINPYSVEALWHKADILASMGRKEAAVEALRTAVTLEPNFCRGYARLAEFAGPPGSPAADAWSAKADDCRKNAGSLPLEESERMLVENVEGR